MKPLLLAIITLITLTGCFKTTPETPTLGNLQSASYKVDNKGGVSLTEVHKFKNGKIVAQEQRISKKDKGYEVVPNFNKANNNSLSLKSEKIYKKSIYVGHGNVKISVESIPLNKFIDLVFSSVLKLNYTVSDNVKNMKKPITLYMKIPQPKQQAFEVIKKILSLNGVKIEKNNGILFISKADKKNTSDILNDLYVSYGKTLDSSIPDDKKVFLFVPYNYISPNSAISILRHIGITPQSVKFYTFLDGVQVMYGEAKEIKKALKIVKLIDRPFLKDKMPYLVELKEIDVQNFLKNIKKIFQANGINIVDHPSKGGILITPIPEINSLFVITPKKSWLKMLLYWKKKLDIASDISQKPRFYIYKVKNRKADDLAEILNKAVAIKLSTNLPEASKKIKSKSIKKPITPQNYSIIADLPTNTLMIKMTPSQYKLVLPLIQKLDALPLEVLVKVTLAEVTMTKNFSLGFEYALKNNKAISPSTANILSGAITSTLGAAGITASYTSKNLSTIINAFAQKKLLNILSEPRILILNNKTGTINVGKQIPTLASEASASDLTNNSTSPSILRNIKYQNTGTIVSLTPTINSNGILTMKVNITLSAGQINNTSKIDSPLIVSRALSTVLTIKSGDSVLLGGLISSNVSNNISGVPGFEDIPLVGNLFKTKDKTRDKTELIMLIQPYIIKMPQDLGEKTQKYRKMLSMLNKYIAF